MSKKGEVMGKKGEVVRRDWLYGRTEEALGNLSRCWEIVAKEPTSTPQMCMERAIAEEMRALLQRVKESKEWREKVACPAEEEERPMKPKPKPELVVYLWSLLVIVCALMALVHEWFSHFGGVVIVGMVGWVAVAVGVAALAVMLWREFTDG